MLGDRLKKARLDCGLTQQQVAELLGIDRSSYTYYETGKSGVSTQTLKLLAIIFGIPFEWLIQEEKKRLEFHSYSKFKPYSYEDEPVHMLSLSTEERQLVARVRMLKFMGKEEEVNNYLEELTESVFPKDEESGNE